MYYIIELKTNGTVGTTEPIRTAQTRNEALGIYYGLLATAATSEEEFHTCMVVDEEGKYLGRECYKHFK